MLDVLERYIFTKAGRISKPTKHDRQRPALVPCNIRTTLRCVFDVAQ